MVAEPSEVIPDGSVLFGPLVAAKAVWDFSKLGNSISKHVCDEVAKMVFIMTSNRLVDPGSKLYVSQWFPRTALPRMLELKPEEVYDERLYRAMDKVLMQRRVSRMPWHPGFTR